MVYTLLTNGIFRGYNPLTNHSLTSWDIQVGRKGRRFSHRLPHKIYSMTFEKARANKVLLFVDGSEIRDQLTSWYGINIPFIYRVWDTSQVVQEFCIKHFFPVKDLLLGRVANSPKKKKLTMEGISGNTHPNCLIHQSPKKQDKDSSIQTWICFFGGWKKTHPNIFSQMEVKKWWWIPWDRIRKTSSKKHKSKIMEVN